MIKPSNLTEDSFQDKSEKSQISIKSSLISINKTKESGSIPKVTVQHQGLKWKEPQLLIFQITKDFRLVSATKKPKKLSFSTKIQTTITSKTDSAKISVTWTSYLTNQSLISNVSSIPTTILQVFWSQMDMISQILKISLVKRNNWSMLSDSTLHLNYVIILKSKKYLLPSKEMIWKNSLEMTSKNIPYLSLSKRPVSNTNRQKMPKLKSIFRNTSLIHLAQHQDSLVISFLQNPNNQLIPVDTWKATQEANYQVDFKP